MTKAGSIVVDTSAIISLFRGHEPARECFNAAQEIGLPVTVLAELYCGLRKCNNPDKERQRIHEMRSRMVVVGTDESTAIRYAEVYASLERQGVMIPVNDLWIAAFALRHEMALVAKDAHFTRIEGLELIEL